MKWVYWKTLNYLHDRGSAYIFKTHLIVPTIKKSCGNHSITITIYNYFLESIVFMMNKNYPKSLKNTKLVIIFKFVNVVKLIILIVCNKVTLKNVDMPIFTIFNKYFWKTFIFTSANIFNFLRKTLSKILNCKNTELLKSLRLLDDQTKMLRFITSIFKILNFPNVISNLPNF